MTEDLSKYKQPFDPEWPHGHLVGNSPARVICSDLKGEFPYVVAFERESGTRETLFCVDSSGIFYTDHRVTNTPAPQRTWWVNLYHDEFNSFKCTGIKYDSREKADKCASSDRFACIKVTEGDGI